jgi:hypothetical protein
VTATQRQTPGPNVRAALRSKPGSRARAKVLLTVAAFLDEGREDPTIRELAERTGLERLAVIQALERLEVDRQLVVRWGDPRRGERNRYEIPGARA